MSRTVDERVVSMQFDNKQFENNVQTSLSTLDKLKQSLNLSRAAKGFENIGSAAKSINFSGLSGTVDAVKERFSALEVMAVTALANITNSAVNTGKQMLNSLTVEPIKQGFGEYELKLDSVQTIMASTGESLETVNGYLQELNTYADKTIYSFSDMTSSIGKFTNSGVKLEDAVKAIQGISNEAAVSGANAQQASHAMYNFAQALSSGSVKLIDWKSIENANMATVEFKNELIKTAVELGTVTKEGEKFVSVTEDANGNISDAFTATSMFNDSLSSNWMTSEVLVKTLAKYSDETSELGKKAFAAAQDVKTFSQLMDTLQEAVGSGWATTWEIIFGDFEEAKKLWTSVSNIVGGFIDSQSDARNSLLQEWKDMGGRAALIEAFKNAFNGFKEIILPIKEAFNNIFPPITAKRLTEISEKLKDLTAKFKIGSELSRNLKDSFSDLFRATKNTFDFLKNAVIMVADAFKEIFPVTDLIGKRFREFGHIVRMLSERFKLNDDAVQNLKSTFKGIFAVIDIVKEAVWALFRNIVPLGEKLGGLPSKILEVTGALGEWFVWLDKSIKENDTFGKALRGIGDFIKNLHTIFKNLFSYLGEKLHLPSISDLTQIIVALVKHLTGAEKLSLFQNTSNALGKIADSTSKLGDSAKKTSDSVKQSIDDVSKKIKENPFVKMLETLWTAIKKVGTAIGKVFGNAINNISKKLSKLSGNELLIILNNLSSLGIGVALSKFVKTFGGPLEKLFDTFSGMGESIGGLADNIGNILNQVGNSLKAYQTQLKAGALQKIAIAIGILAVSILILSSIDKAGLKQATSAITIMFVELMGSLAVLSKIIGLIEISVGLLIMAQAIKMMGSMNTEDLGKGLLGLFVGLNSISMALQNMPTGIAKKAAGLIILAVALLFMEEVIKKLGSLDFFTLGKGLIGMSVGLLSMTMAMRNMPNAERIAASSSAIVAISKGLEFMAKAIKEIGSMSLQDVAEGVLAITVALAAIVVAIRDMPDEKKTAASSAGITAIARALEPMAKAIKEIGSMSLQDIGEGILGIVVALFAVAAAVRYMPDPKKTAASIAGFVAVVGTFRDIAFAMKEIGSLKWDEFVRGMAGLNLTVITLVVALEAMQDAKVLLGAAALVIASTAIMIFVPAIMMLSRIGWDGLAISLIAIAGAFAILGVSAKILGKMAPQILSMSFSIASLGISIGVSLAGIAMGMAAFGAGIAGVGLGILVFGLGLQELAIGLTTFGGSLVVAAVELVAAMGIIVASMDDIILPLIDKLVVVIIALLKGIVDIIKELMPDIREVIKETLEMIFGIIIRLPELVKSIVNLFIMLFASVFDALAEIDPKIFEKVLLGIGEISLIIVAMSGISTLIPSAMSGVLGMAAFVFELTAVLTALGALAQIPGLMWIIGEGGNLLEGIGNAIGKFVGGIVGGIMEGISSSFPKIGTDLSAFMENAKPFIDGAKNVDADAMNGVKALADVILTLTAANILDGLTSWFTGGTSLADFGKELATFGPEFKKYCDSIDGIDGEKVQASANAAKALSEMADNLPTHGGVKGWWNGDSSLSSFAEELADFAPSLVEYSQSVEGLSTDVVENSATAAKALFAMTDNLPKHGGMVEWFTGSNKLSDFAKELPEFGYGMHLYWLEVDGIDSEIVESSANAAKALAELANITPNTGGMASWFTGEKSVSAFGEQLQAFGAGIQAYANEVTGVEPEVVTSSANAAESLVMLSEKLSNQGGIFSFFTGDKNIGVFGERLVIFGEKFAAYADKIKEVKPETLSATTAAASSLVDLQNDLGDDGSLFSSSKTIADFGEELNKFGGFFKTFYANIKDVKPEQLKNVLAEINKIVELAKGLNKLNTEGMKNFGEGLKAVASGAIQDFIKEFDNAKSKIEKAANDMLDNFRTAVNGNKLIFQETFSSLAQDCVNGLYDKNDKFTVAGKDVIGYFMDGVLSMNNDIVSSAQKAMNGFINGIGSKKGDVQFEAVTVVIFAVSAIKDKYNDFYSAGIYLIDGFILGIKSNISKVENTAKEMANTAAQASKKALDEHSPSRVGYEIGAFFGMGFVNALSDYSDKSYSAGENVALSAKNGLNQAISKIADTVDRDMDIQPTIRPVVDLSEVRKSADSIGSMFGATRSVNLASMAGIGVNTVNANVQNEVRLNNDNIIREMRDLKKDISNLSQTVGRMKIVMDTGALVGAIATPINNELGRQSIYYKRGN